MSRAPVVVNPTKLDDDEAFRSLSAGSWMYCDHSNFAANNER
jgi:hypothetical protein